MHRDQCLRVFPALRGAVFARARRPVSCARRARRKPPRGRVRAASVLKIDGAPSSCTALRIPSRGTKVVIGQKSGGTMKRSPPQFCSDTSQRGLWATAWADLVCEQLKSCVLMSVMFAWVPCGSSARGLLRPIESCVSPWLQRPSLTVGHSMLLA